MRWNVKTFAALLAQTCDLREPIYEFGAREDDGQAEGVANLRPLFSQKYVGCDMRAGRGVDMILDLHHIDLPTAAVPAVFAFDTLEHVKLPTLACAEIHRILDSKGFFALSVPFSFFIHAQPDYWRFTPEAVELLLTPFAKKVIFAEGYEQNPHTVFALASKDPDFDFNPFMVEYTALEKTRAEYAQVWDATDEYYRFGTVEGKELVPIRMIPHE